MLTTQQLEDWIGSHVRAFSFIGGCTEILVPDNLRSGVHKADFYNPVLNRTYGEMAAHYSVAVIPARKYRPRDKAKVEQSVLLAQRWILARLRNRRLFSLEEANRAIAELLIQLNNKPFKKLPGCRRSVFEELDRLLEIDDIDSISCSEDVRLHFRVPAFRLMTEMDPCLQKLFHGYL